MPDLSRESPAAMSARHDLAARALALGALALSAACSGREEGVASPPPAVPEGAEILEWVEPDPPLEPPPAISDAAEPGPRTPPRTPVERAPAPDSAFASDETVPARRVVYRVRLGVPGILGSPFVELVTPAAELYVDVSLDRLRARFVGPGWPLHEGAEVRLRGDSPGAYVFDGTGGRSLEPGALAGWVEGGAPRPGPRAYVRRDAGANDAREPLPGPLVCALVAEWAGVPRSTMGPRCGNAAPIAFRAGAYRAERTADVPITLPRRALRADESDPPEGLVATTSRSLLERDALARLRTEVRRGDDREIERDGDGAPADGLVLENRSDGRIVLVVDGIVAGYADALSEVHLEGLPAGVHEVGAMRPLGAVVMRPRLVAVPGRTVLRARPARDD